MRRRSNGYDLSGLLILAILSNALANEFTPLQRGVLIEKHGTVSVINGKWNVIVTIQEPTCPQSIISRYHDFRDEIRRVIKIRPDMKMFQVRIAALDRDLSCDYFARRRRGLFDLGGDIFHSLFGVATDKELNTIHHVISNNKNNIKQLYHDRDRLISVVNKTILAISENRKHLTILDEDIQNVSVFTVITQIASL